MVSYLGYSEHSERGNFMGGGSLLLYLVVLLITASCRAGNMLIQDKCLLKWMPWHSEV